MASTVVVLGGGIGGLVTARRLRGLLQSEHRVVLVDRSPRHVFWPALTLAATGARDPADATRDLARLSARGIEVRQGTVLAIDPARRTATVDDATLEADHLIVALGAELAPDLVPGSAHPAAHHFHTPDAAVRLRDAVAGFGGGRVAVVVPPHPTRCPTAPYEAAFLLNAALLRRGVPAVVTVYAPEAVPLPALGVEAGLAVQERLRDHGIAFQGGQRVSEVRGETREVVFANGERVSCELLVAIPPVRAPAVLREAGLLESGWVPVDRETLATRHEGVWAIGDAAAIPLADGSTLPKAGVFAHGQAEVVAANVAALVRGRRPGERFDGYGACFLETGGGRAAFASGDFYAAPSPRLRLRPPARRWHWGRLWWERNWLRKWF